MTDTRSSLVLLKNECAGAFLFLVVYLGLCLVWSDHLEGVGRMSFGASESSEDRLTNTSHAVPAEEALLRVPSRGV